MQKLGPGQTQFITNPTRFNTKLSDTNLLYRLEKRVGVLEPCLLNDTALQKSSPESLAAVAGEHESRVFWPTNATSLLR